MSKKDLWLTMLSFSVLAAVVLVFYWLRIQPIEIPKLERPDVEIGSVDSPTVTFVNPMRGSASPKVTIIEFADFQCAACKTLGESIDVVLRTYPEDIRHVWKDLPNESAHELATPAAIAAHCADEQGKFWEYHDALFDRQVYLSESQFPLIADELDLKTETWQACYDSRDTLPVVKKDYEEGLGLGIIATPTIFINDEMYVGALSTEELMSYVQKALQTNN